jgi:DNA-binding NtrC family response regulator
MKRDKLTVLLIEKSSAEASRIKSSLVNLMEEPCCVLHYNCPKKARVFLADNSVDIDIILLDLTILDQENPRHVFKKVNAAGHETPVIVFTQSEEHELAKSVIHEGAADNITLEVFHNHPESLRDAILFSLARNDLVNSIKNKASVELENIYREHRQVVNMLTGGYSFDESISYN